MNNLAWIIIAILVVPLIFFYGLWRGGTRDRNNLAQFAVLLMLHPDVYEVQKNNFLRMVPKVKADSRKSLLKAILITLSDHAAKVDQSYPNIELLWQLNQQPKIQTETQPKILFD